MQAHGMFPRSLLGLVSPRWYSPVSGEKPKDLIFLGLVGAYSEQVRRVLFAVIGDESLADEACVRVFLIAYGNPSLGRDPLVEILKLAVGECRDFPWSSWNNDASQSEADPSRRYAMALLHKLSLRARLLMVLCEVAGLSVDQIGSVLQSPLDDVRADLLKARRQLVKTARGMNETN